MKSSIYTFLLTLCSVSLWADNILITDADLVGGQTYNWTADNTYTLDGFVFLEAGGILNIEPGTQIIGQAEPTGNDLASSLIITRGAKIFAIGNASNPIVFKSEFFINFNDRKQWGGLVVLGNGILGDTAPEKRIEGFPDGEDRALYGGNDDTDNSGIIRYVSIRHGGAEIAEGDEINGLTLGGVGSGTMIDHVEVIGNSDDGIEFFGGAVSVKYAVVSFCGDDAIDYDTGWRGNVQFAFVLQGDDQADSAGEHDGAKPDDNARFANPNFYNCTYIGSGLNAAPDIKNAYALLFRDGAGGTYANSIFTSFANFALEVEDLAEGLDARQRMENGELNLKNNIWWEFGEGDQFNTGTNGILVATEGAPDASAQFLIDHLAANDNVIADPQLVSISRTADNGLHPYPSPDGPAYENLADYPADPFFTPVGYKGAFGLDGNTLDLSWTALEEYNILSSTVGVAEVTAENGMTLSQSVPNPTAGSALIEFSLPAGTDVIVTVFDLSGKVVSVLADNARFSAGTHTVELDASELNAGIYFYTLTTKDVSLTKSLIVK